MYLGLDLGTSGLRALLTDDAGRTIDTAEAAFSVQTPHKGWSEQDPRAWVDGLREALGTLKTRRATALGQVRAIGLSGQMHGAVVLDRDDAVLRPCILWNDTRSAEEAAAFDAVPEVHALSGNIAFPGFTAPKLIWMARHEPELFARVAKVLLPKDYLRLYLTGEHATDLSDAAGTAWCDVAGRTWSEALLSASGMRSDQMPRLVEGSEVSGRLRKAICEDFGLPATAVVVGGGADNAAAACGSGCVQEGQGFVSLGTSGVILAARDRCLPDPTTAVHTFCHALPERWYQMGVILAATDALNWLGRLVDEATGHLAGRLPERPEGPSATLFLPYLSGERTPHNDAEVRGAFVGLDIAQDRADLTAAVMEGVGFALRDSLEALRGTGAQVDHLLAVGGGTQSRYWLHALASILNVPLQRPAEGELGAALGAVRLAMMGDGRSVAETMTQPEIAEQIAPDATLRGAYEQSYGRYRALYPNIKAALT
ncbi:xylulokinase [Gymnodinialimonas ulvae]|uniref:xylulokinase n=1 Tax=Gymnodinialimonas ulvae TaxID=3126504 RepID=UPI00309786CC